MENGFNERARLAKEQRLALEERLLSLGEQQGADSAVEIVAGELGIPVKQLRNRLHQWKHKYPEFAVRWAMLAGGAETIRTKAQLEGFPKDDFLKFRELYCAYKRQRDARWVRATNTWFHEDAYRRFMRSNRLIVILPPGHNKTSLYAIELPTWLIMGDRDVRIGVVQKNADEAKKLIATVEERLSDWDYYRIRQERLKDQGDPPIVNPLDAHFFKNPFRPANKRTGETWGAYSFKVSGRESGEKDNTMQAFGVGSQIQGGRFDYLILDDVQDPTQANNPADAHRLLDWFERVIMGRVTDTQKVVVCANFFAPDDFAHKLIEAHPEFDVVQYPALIRPSRISGDEPTAEEELVPLWPEYWSVEGLAKKRVEVRETVWHYTWMQDEGSFDEQTFKRDILDAAKNEELRVGEVPHDVTDVFVGCDPAIAASGHCAMVIWGLNRKTQQRYLIDVFNKTGMRNWDNVIAQLVEFTNIYHPRVVVLEMNNTQGSLANNPSLQRSIRSGGARLQTYQTVTGLGARAEQTNFDITTIGGLFDAGLITLAAGGTFDEVTRIEDYIDQLVAWRTDDLGHSIKHLKRDMVMATLFAESEAFLVANKPVEKPKQHGIRRWSMPSWGAQKRPSAELQTLP